MSAPAYVNVVRFYQHASRKRVIRHKVPLWVAQEHCSDPETSSSTCSKAAGLARTRRMGPWFDGYEEVSK